MTISANASTGLGSLQLLAEHPTWKIADVRSLLQGAPGYKGDATIEQYLQQNGFSASAISNFMSGKINAQQLIATHPAAGEGNSSGVGNATSGVTSAIGSAVSSVASPFEAVGSFLGDLTNIDLWKGLGLILAGGLILIFAAYEFAHLAGVNAAPVPIPV